MFLCVFRSCPSHVSSGFLFPSGTTQPVLTSVSRFGLAIDPFTSFPRRLVSSTVFAEVNTATCHYLSLLAASACSPFTRENKDLKLIYRQRTDD